MISTNKWIKWLEECHLKKTPIRITNDEFIYTKENFYKAAKRIGIKPKFKNLIDGKILIYT